METCCFSFLKMTQYCNVCNEAFHITLTLIMDINFMCKKNYSSSMNVT